MEKDRSFIKGLRESMRDEEPDPDVKIYSEDVIMEDLGRRFREFFEDMEENHSDVLDALLYKELCKLEEQGEGDSEEILPDFLKIDEEDEIIDEADEIIDDEEDEEDEEDQFNFED